MKSIAVLMSSYNRCAKTLACLESVYLQTILHAKYIIQPILVDDNSTDETVASISLKFPEVRILHGTGDLYWNRSMRVAFSDALERKYHYYLWLNDDVILYRDALERLLHAAERTNNNAIIVGSVQDPLTGIVTYGGMQRCSRWHPLKFSLVAPGHTLIEIETMNGNLVLIPSGITERVGNLDINYHHSIGDFDYGLRATKLGLKIFLAPGYFGCCPENNLQGTWSDTSLIRTQRWKLVTHPKGLPPEEWKIFARRYAGQFWFFYWILPYVRILLGR